MGPRLTERLERLGIRRVQDLLFHLPLRYQDRTRITPMGSVLPGMETVVQGTLAGCELRIGRRSMLLCQLADATGSVWLRFFHFTAAQRASLQPGTLLRCFGEVREGPYGAEMVHPEYRRLEDAAQDPVEEHLTPIYPTTAGLGQLSLRQLTDRLLDDLGLLAGAQSYESAGLEDWLPEAVTARLRLPSLAGALAYVHRPPPDASLAELSSGTHPAQRRLAFEELLAHHLSLRQLRAHLAHQQAPRISSPGRLAAALMESLPFTLTGAQQRVIGEILGDLASERPMQRLLQGDVGSGKTLVAVAAVLHVVEAGLQAAVMAPTELLAEQHFKNFGRWLSPLAVTTAWLSGRHKGRARAEVLEGLAQGRAQVVVGTHALFQEDVVFHDLGLVVIDEQHRFGVHQRLALREKGRGAGGFPHQLIMTATPIPRTLAMTAYADLDTSVIDELPPGRTPVTTVLVPDTRRDEVVERVHRACREERRQAYWVCTLVEESEASQAQAAADTAARLVAALPELRIGLVHGRMRPADKEQVMTAFAAGDIDLLVATTVIEVGVDVPNASLMIIENAERLGLAQLHQLRGRVGRGSTASACVLLFHAPLTEIARERLRALKETNSGFAIAQKDLEQRGPGEVLGTRQTGALQFRIADLLRDAPLLPAVERAARLLQTQYPEHVQPLIQRWLAEGTRYGEV